MKGLHLKWEGEATGKIYFTLIESYSFTGGEVFDSSDSDDYIADSDLARVILNCICGSNNWKDNGRFMNEYECDSCGAFVEVTEVVK